MTVERRGAHTALARLNRDPVAFDGKIHHLKQDLVREILLDPFCDPVSLAFLVRTTIGIPCGTHDKDHLLFRPVLGKFTEKHEFI
jgi:hypothetical protein